MNVARLSSSHAPWRAWLLRTAPLLNVILPIAFAITLAQHPLFTDNQTTKYLHGAAAAGYGLLKDDWVANTVDPLPVFSGLVEVMYRLGIPQLSYALFALCAMVYAWALTRIAAKAQLFDAASRSQTWLFVIGFLLVHAVQKSWPQGLAQQYLLGTYFQPCVFGVLLLLAVYHFMMRRALVAIVLAATAAIFHPDYLFGVVVCVLVFAFWRWPDEQPSRVQPLLRIALFLLIIAPLAYSLTTTLKPTNSEIWKQSLNILANVRIPHHAAVRYWFDSESLFRLAFMTAGVVLARDRALRCLMAALLVAIVLPLAFLAVVRIPALQAITPWRVSVFLMPLASTVLIARVIALVGSTAARHERSIAMACCALLVVAIGAGVSRHIERFQKYAANPALPVMRYARQHAAPEQTYLVPPREPLFYPFRLETGIPIVINWRTHSYKDVELLAWYRRYREAAAFYAARRADTSCVALSQLVQAYSITHIVVSNAHPTASSPCMNMQLRYSTPKYRLYEWLATESRS